MKRNINDLYLVKYKDENDNIVEVKCWRMQHYKNYATITFEKECGAGKFLCSKKLKYENIIEEIKLYNIK